MARIPWILTDPAAVETYVFEVNPREGGSPSYRKNITTKTTTAPAAGAEGARTLLFEGADEPSSFDANGTLLTEAQYDALLEWYNKRVLLQLEDDLGRTFVIYLTGIDFKRTPKPSHPWRHTFAFTSVLV